MVSEQDAAYSLGDWDRLDQRPVLGPDLKAMENRSEWK